METGETGSNAITVGIEQREHEPLGISGGASRDDVVEELTTREITELLNNDFFPLEFFR